MENMASAIQNYNTNLLKDAAAPTAKECSYRQKSNCPLAEKCLSLCLVYQAQVERSYINKLKIIMVLANKISKTVTTTILLLLKTKTKKKVQNSQNISTLRSRIAGGFK